MRAESKPLCLDCKISTKYNLSYCQLLRPIAENIYTKANSNSRPAGTPANAKANRGLELRNHQEAAIKSPINKAGTSKLLLELTIKVSYKQTKSIMRSMTQQSQKIIVIIKKIGWVKESGCFQNDASGFFQRATKIRVMGCGVIPVEPKEQSTVGQKGVAIKKAPGREDIHGFFEPNLVVAF